MKSNFKKAMQEIFVDMDEELKSIENQPFMQIPSLSNYLNFYGAAKKEIQILGIDTSVLQNDLATAHTEAMQSMVPEFADHLDAMMAANWGWTSGARDIIDTGALKNSKSVEYDGDSIVTSYSAPYANLIHNGGYIAPYGNKNIAKVYIPGRPWIMAAYGLANGPLPPYNFAERYEYHFSAAFG